jgi:drug/metabolite transporter (DMT)-like permease
MFRKRVTPTILAFLIFSDILETVTHFCFKKSTFAASDFSISSLYNVFIFIKIVIFSPYLWLGFISVGLTFIIWSTILSKIDLSVAVPVASFSYILVPLVSIIFLGEKINALRWLGIFCILIGIIFASISSKEKVTGAE